ncbi:hypothetical protein Vafri_16421 [Volvox africanus]|uniref:Uncharacterized protein n=1 Tax=Volvox africanus TaxID=51714 RepID=A0A8J4BIZ9_9CHLO|nr:hypothetical protein Vafri_16421 [Volvox africanus]
MIPLTFEEAVGYFGIYIFLLCMCLAVIVALYYLAELVEEHLRITKKVIVYTIIGKLVVVTLLWILEGVDFATIAPTIAAPLGYWRVVHRHFPFLSFRDPALVVSGLLTVAAHIMWMRYHMTTFHHITVVLGFFLVVVWLVPFQLLVSLAANENCLPGIASGMPTSYYAPSGGSSGGGSSGVARGTAGGGEPSGARGGGRRKGTRTLLSSLFDRLRGQGQDTGRRKDRDY